MGLHGNKLTHAVDIVYCSYYKTFMAKESNKKDEGGMKISDYIIVPLFGEAYSLRQSEQGKFLMHIVAADAFTANSEWAKDYDEGQGVALCKKVKNRHLMDDDYYHENIVGSDPSVDRVRVADGNKADTPVCPRCLRAVKKKLGN
tara:strand:+ start:2195 stop:2629 length:435 start_codon:yes stop_codon:yes gene_type:complete